MKNVLIIFGGNSFEHEISCNSVNFIIENIDESKFKYRLVGIDYDNNWFEIKDISRIDKNWKHKYIEKIDNINAYIKNFDIVFPMIHGAFGEDGKIQSILETQNVKYVGCDSISSLICYDKFLTKVVLEKYDIPQIDYQIYNGKFKNIEFPIIVKPSKCGSSLGISIVKNKKELKKAIKLALKYDNRIILEKYIQNNRELECAILEDKNKLIVSDIGEIMKKGTWYDYNSKYISKYDTFISDINKKIKQEIKSISKKVFKILGCKGLSRIDFLYDLDSNKLYFNEINTMPGFTSISMYPKLIMNEGINPKELIIKLLEL